MEKSFVNRPMNEKNIQPFLENVKFPALVTFPRSGCHWLTMLIELYFERPSLRQVFYFHDQKDYLMIHTHDHDLECKKENVVYVYRTPTNTMFSVMNYYSINLECKDFLIMWLDKYIEHITHWLLDETFTKKKTIITYDRLQSDFESEFIKIINHFNYAVDKIKISEIQEIATKQQLINKMPGRPINQKRLTNICPRYSEHRIEFANKNKDYIRNYILEKEPRLERWI